MYVMFETAQYLGSGICGSCAGNLLVFLEGMFRFEHVSWTIVLLPIRSFSLSVDFAQA